MKRCWAAICFVVVFSATAAFPQDEITFTGGQETVQKVKNAVVSISCIAKGNIVGYRRWLPRENKTGVGVFIDKKGYIATAYSLVRSMSSITVKIAGGKDYPAKIVAYDQFIDIALLRLNDESVEAPEALQFDETGSLAADTKAIAAGNYKDGSANLISAAVTRLNRIGRSVSYIENLIQFNAEVVLEDHGGPLLNQDGLIVGINVSTGSKRAGIGLAVPADMARNSLKNMIENGAMKYPYIGTYVREINKGIRDFNYIDETLPAEGLLVIGVPEDSPAKAAGLNFADAIVAFDGSPVTSYLDMHNLIYQKTAGTQITLTVVSKGERKNVPVTLGERPAKDVFNVQNFCRLYLGFDLAREGGKAGAGAFKVKRVYFHTGGRKEVSYGEGDVLAQIAPGKPYGIPEPVREMAQLAGLIYPDSILYDGDEFGLDLFFAKTPGGFGNRVIFRGSMMKTSY
ncbi:MAG: serine protease [Spirochaetes bacterium]|nr:serine protease [Spirochaetota bacterium]